MNKAYLRKNLNSSMFTASNAAFFGMEIINFNKKNIVMNCSIYYTVDKNMILGGIYNDTNIFN